MPMSWLDVTGLNRKWDDVVLQGIGAGIHGMGSVLNPVNARRGVGAVDTNTVWMAQMFLNEELRKRGMAPVRDDGVMDPTVCGALVFVLERVRAGETVDQGFADFMKENGRAFDSACTNVALDPPEAIEGGYGAPLPPPTPEPEGPGERNVDWIDCWISQGDTGPHVVDLQHKINQALLSAGFEAIPETGVFDAATCGAMFELGGSFSPPIAECPAWVVPHECPDMTMPRKSGNVKMGAFAVGGLLVAVGLGGAYWLSNR